MKPEFINASVGFLEDLKNIEKMVQIDSIVPMKNVVLEKHIHIKNEFLFPKLYLNIFRKSILCVASICR